MITFDYDSDNNMVVYRDKVALGTITRDEQTGNYMYDGTVLSFSQVTSVFMVKKMLQGVQA